MHTDYLNPVIRQLRDQQVRFAPREKKIEQVTQAERLLAELDPGRIYPYEYICFRITNYRPESYPDLRLSGQEASHDLRLFVEDVSVFRGVLHGAEIGPHIQTYPFQGVLARKDRIAAAGFPREDLYLGCEDLEWTPRLSALGTGIVYVRAAEIVHDDRSVQIRKRFLGMTFIIPEPAALWKFYYSVRNRILIAKMWYKPYVVNSLLGFFKVLIASFLLGAPRQAAADYGKAMLDGWRGITGERSAGKVKN